MRSLLVLITAAALALNGCASSAQYGSREDGLSADQRVVRANAERMDYQEHEQDTTSEGILVGAVLLGALACGIALAAGGKGQDCAVAGAAGAAVGAGAGYIAGSWVASKQTSYASKEDYYRDVIVAADKEIAENRKAAQAANRLAAQHQARIAELNASYASKQTTASAYRKQYKVMADDTTALDATIQTNRERIAELDQLIAEAGSGSAGQSLRQRRDQLAAENATLERAYNELVAALATAPKEVQT